MVRALSILALAPWLGAMGAPSAGKPVQIRAPDMPDDGRQCVDASYQAFSIEFANFHDYTGNSTYTNELNVNLVQNLRRLSGKPLHMRVGGSSQNVARWDANNPVGISARYVDDKARTVAIGPSFTDGFDVWPSDTKYIWGLPFNFTTYDNLVGTDLHVAPLVAQHLGDRLDMFEIGNEFGHGHNGGPVGYVDLWLGYARNISEKVWGSQDVQRFFVGSFQEPKCDWEADPKCYDVEGILKQGILDTGLGKAANTHMYMGDSSEPWVDIQFLLNHNNTAGHVDIHKRVGAYTTSVGLPYSLGETNSVSGHGKVGVSDVFASALWTVDYIMYSAQTNISRVYLHQGNGWKYSAWNPYDAFGIAGGVKGSYYSYLFSAVALSGSDKQVEILHSDQRFVAYGIYAGGCSTHSQGSRRPGRRGKLQSIVAVNLQAWSKEDPQSERPSVTIDLSRSLRPFSRATVQRLTAPGADSLEEISFRGQTVAEDGKLKGHMKTERVVNGRVAVAASEAVLITL